MPKRLSTKGIPAITGEMETNLIVLRPCNGRAKQECEDEEIAFVSHRFYRVHIIFFACSCASMTLSHHWSNSGSSTCSSGCAKM